MDDVQKTHSSETVENTMVSVIKIGGNVIDDEESLSGFLKDFSSIKGCKILIHGGGKIATRIGEKLAIQSKYINGRRITDDETIDLVTMVYGGLINKKIVAQLQAYDCNAIGLTGADANIIPAVKRAVKETDYGWVGDIKPETICTNIIENFLETGIVPVFAALTHDAHAHILNTNADTIASSLAVALSPKHITRLIYCFEKKGVLENVNDEDSVIHFMNKQKYETLLAGEKLFEGIIPKIENAFAAIEAGVHQVIIGASQDVLKNSTREIQGTLIYR